MVKSGFLGGGVRMTRNHSLVPMLDFRGRMFDRALMHPTQDGIVFLEAMHCVFELVSVDLQKAEEMFVEPDCLVVVAVEKAFAVESSFIDQARQMDIIAELFVRTARMQSAHEMHYVACAGCAPPSGISDSFFFSELFTSGKSSPWVRFACPI